MKSMFKIGTGTFNNNFYVICFQFSNCSSPGFSSAGVRYSVCWSDCLMELNWIDLTMELKDMSKIFMVSFFLYINIFIHYIIYVWEKKLTVNCISFDDIKYTCKKHMVKGTQLFISIRWPFAIGLCCCPSSTNNFTFLISENYVANSFHF